MRWNWQNEDWPRFRYEFAVIRDRESQFVFRAGQFQGVLKHVGPDDQSALTIDLLGQEAFTNAEIEGEMLDRDSLQSSLLRQFGLTSSDEKVPPPEQGMAELMVDLYRSYEKPLSDNLLFDWHRKIFRGAKNRIEVGHYRSSPDLMRVVSGSVHNPRIHFEAPPSERVAREMGGFVEWFNKTAPGKNESLPTLVRAGLAHLYFESIHPFEDGNGRIGRAISEKALSQGLGHPALIALSQTILKKRKSYYDALENANKSIEVTPWLDYFSSTVLDAQEYAQMWVEFLVNKANYFDRHSAHFNDRQEKAILRIFKEGPDGFKGGLSAENYIRITNTSRATATRDLQDLVAMKALSRKGELKGTRYYLAL
jgi:Fic family protein